MVVAMVRAVRSTPTSRDPSRSSLQVSITPAGVRSRSVGQRGVACDAVEYGARGAGGECQGDAAGDGQGRVGLSHREHHDVDVAVRVRLGGGGDDCEFGDGAGCFCDCWCQPHPDGGLSADVIQSFQL